MENNRTVVLCLEDYLDINDKLQKWVCDSDRDQTAYRAGIQNASHFAGFKPDRQRFEGKFTLEGIQTSLDSDQHQQIDWNQ